MPRSRALAASLVLAAAAGVAATAQATATHGAPPAHRPDAARVAVHDAPPVLPPAFRSLPHGAGVVELRSVAGVPSMTLLPRL